MGSPLNLQTYYVVGFPVVVGRYIASADISADVLNFFKYWILLIGFSVWPSVGRGTFILTAVRSDSYQPSAIRYRPIKKKKNFNIGRPLISMQRCWRILHQFTLILCLKKPWCPNFLWHETIRLKLNKWTLRQGLKIACQHMSFLQEIVFLLGKIYTFSVCIE